MDWQARLTATVLSTIARDFPRGFWDDCRTAIGQGYPEAFHRVAADPNLVTEQKLDKLYQDRHFLMEHLLRAIADRHGVPCTSTLIEANNRHYVYVANGAIGLTQSYVPAMGAMPKAAKYRELHATINAITSQRRLALGDEPEQVLIGKDFYGVLTHNPLGKRFIEHDQRLGMIQFCIPLKDFSDWAVQLTIQEILATYESAAPTKKADRSMPWKTTKKKDEGKE